MSIKYYRLAKGETPPEEFCAVRDVGGEPSEYVFYVPESDAAKLRELVRELYEIAQPEAPSMFEAEFADRMRELGIEVES